MNPVRVLVVDDQALFRRVMSAVVVGRLCPWLATQRQARTRSRRPESCIRI